MGCLFSDSLLDGCYFCLAIPRVISKNRATFSGVTNGGVGFFRLEAAVLPCDVWKLEGPWVVLFD